MKHLITVHCESNPDYPRYCKYWSLGYDFVVEGTGHMEHITNCLIKYNQPLIRMEIQDFEGKGKLWSFDEIEECIKKGYE